MSPKAAAHGCVSQMTPRPAAAQNTDCSQRKRNVCGARVGDRKSERMCFDCPRSTRAVTLLTTEHVARHRKSLLQPSAAAPSGGSRGYRWWQPGVHMRESSPCVNGHPVSDDGCRSRRRQNRTRLMLVGCPRGCERSGPDKSGSGGAVKGIVGDRVPSRTFPKRRAAPPLHIVFARQKRDMCSSRNSRVLWPSTFACLQFCSYAQTPWCARQAQSAHRCCNINAWRCA